jgi:hypothetical protein
MEPHKLVKRQIIALEQQGTDMQVGVMRGHGHLQADVEEWTR